jgi:hypothetical protein
MFCPTNVNASKAFSRFVQRTTMLLCCLLVLPKALSSDSYHPTTHEQLRSPSIALPATTSASVCNIVSVVYYQFCVHDFE